MNVVLQRSENIFELTQEKELQPDVMELIISSMDSEWDKECAKCLLSYGKTRGDSSRTFVLMLTSYCQRSQI